MASYQDIETRLAVLEDKIDFVMKVFTIRVTHQSNIIGGEPTVKNVSLLDAYLDVKAAGLSVANPTEKGEDQ